MAKSTGRSGDSATRCIRAEASCHPARDLVLHYSSQAGNYDYGFSWIFHQNGTLEMSVSLSGVMSVKGVPDGAPSPYAHLVAKNIAATHHQHYFAFRLDMDVDGAAN